MNAQVKKRSAKRKKRNTLRFEMKIKKLYQEKTLVLVSIITVGFRLLE
jgi:hypothetical protein